MTVDFASDPSGGHVYKRDLLGSVARTDDGRRVARDPRCAAPGLRWIARLLAANEGRALRQLEGIDGLPRPIGWRAGRLERGYLDGRTMQQAGVADPAYFSKARRLLASIHRRGIAHNDLAKEANWLVTASGEPALVDFQLAWRSPRRSRLFRLLAREDLRHLLKHKRTYFPGRLTPVERRLLARPSWLRQAWFATGKPVYRFVTRRLLRWRDNEGRHPDPEDS